MRNHPHNHCNQFAGSRSFTQFMPLIIIMLIIIVLTAITQWYRNFSWGSAMLDFMGIFFIVFASFKIINLTGFASAYRMYDVIAQRSTAYAYCYPFIELALGIAYLARWQLLITNLVTIVITTTSSIGVLIQLRKKQHIVCACLGALFKLPMTYVTLVEDLLMAGMALLMIIFKS